MVQGQQLVPTLGVPHIDPRIICSTCRSKTLMSEEDVLVRELWLCGARGFPLQALDSARLQISHLKGT
jgi:hypothetical protein